MKNINSDIQKSRFIKKEFYIKKSYFNKVINNIFKNSWQFITDKKLMKKDTIYPFVFLNKSINEPMIFINQDEIKCYSNICTHRAHTIIQKKCNKKLLQCRYHGRTFNLDGTLNCAPGFEDAINFPTKQENLIKYESNQWHQFLFAAINSKIEINTILNDIDKRLPNYNFSELNYDSKNSKTYLINAHWALYCENYLEGFHVPFIHKGLIKDISYNSYQTILMNNAVLQIAESANQHEAIKNTENIYAYYYWIFPNLMINIYNWGLSINIIEPINPSKTKIKFLSYPFKKQVQPLNLNSSLDNVEIEDQEVVLEVQKGIKSIAYNGGRYSPKFETGLHHFHKLIKKYLVD